MIFVVMNSKEDFDCIVRTDRRITAKRFQQMIDRANDRWNRIDQMSCGWYARLHPDERWAYEHAGLMGLVCVLYPAAELEVLNFDDIVHMP